MDFNLNNVLSILDKNRKKNYLNGIFLIIIVWDNLFMVDERKQPQTKLNKTYKNNNKNDYQLQTAITNQFVIKIN